MSRDLPLPALLAQENGASNIQFSPGQAGPGGETAAPAGTEGVGDAGGGSPWSFWLMLLMLFGFMWFFVIRPESKRRKQQQSFHSGLKKGDEVVTIGGMHGSIVAIEDNVVTLKVADALRLKFDRNAIARAASSPQQAVPPSK